MLLCLTGSPARYAEEFRIGLRDFNYSFTDPKAYKGPVVRGWEPDKSRDVRRYIRPNEDTVLSGQCDITWLLTSYSGKSLAMYAINSIYVPILVSF